jgi:hypothetical protein
MPKYNFWSKNTNDDLPEDWSDESKYFANRSVSSGGTRDWYNGSEYVYTHHKDGRITTDGPHIEGHEETDFEKGTNNHR